MKIKKYVLSLLIMTLLVIGNNVKAISSPGEIILEKTATKEDYTYGRTAKIKLNVNANGFTIVDKTDVVLVLDRSTSMNGNSITETKKAAKDLINILLTEETKKNVRVGLSVYGNSDTRYSSNTLTNDKESLIKLIDLIPISANNVGTNIHAGLKKANSLLNNTESNRIIILLSDGEPTFYDGNNNTICGNGNSDMQDFRQNCNVTIDNNNYSKPSKVTKAYATSIKKNITIYTIGFNIGNNNNAKTILKDIATTSKKSYLANDYTSLTKTFTDIVNNFTLVATDGIVQDIIPAGFKLLDLPNNATKIVNSDETITIKWNIGNIKSTETNTLEYTIEAKKDYYGSMYTNTKASLTANPTENNPKYKTTILLTFPTPTVLIPVITNNDDYSNDKNYDVKQNDVLSVNALNGLLTNDNLLNKSIDDNKNITNKIIITTNDNNIKVNNDGSFTFTGSILGKNVFEYLIETTDGANTVKSNTSTITLNVVKKPMSYVVNYYEKNTKTSLSKQKIVKENVYLFDTIKENSIKIKGYIPEKTEETLKINETKNEINFYYAKRNDLKAVINYYEENTKNKIHDSKIIENLQFEDTLKEKSIEIPNYETIEIEKEIIIDETNNEINFYYKKSLGKVKTLFMDSNGETIDENIIEGVSGTTYKTESKSIKDYQLINVIGDEEGLYTNDLITIKYVYEKVPNTGLFIKNTSYMFPVSILSLSIIGIIKKYLVK